jgi:hypothetical protein
MKAPWMTNLVGKYLSQSVPECFLFPITFANSLDGVDGEVDGELQLSFRNETAKIY